MLVHIYTTISVCRYNVGVFDKMLIIGHVKFILIVVQLVVIDYLLQKLLACFYMQKMKICFVTLGHRDVWGLRRIRHLECWLHCY